MIYGRDKTIHQTTDVNVELDKKGNVVAVWFRCCALSFTQSVCGDDRARDMKQMYKDGYGQKLIAVEILDKEKR